jgi:hypothetical protein
MLDLGEEILWVCPCRHKPETKVTETEWDPMKS